VVTLFGPTDPRLSAPRGRTTVVTHPVPCAPCFYRSCPIEHPCLDGIAPERVYTALALVTERAGVGASR
jgi:heptosyltransferase-2